MKEFYWDKDIVKSFDFIACYLDKEQVREAVTSFVESAHTSPHETEEDLVTDLMRQIYE